MLHQSQISTFLNVFIQSAIWQKNHHKTKNDEYGTDNWTCWWWFLHADELYVPQACWHQVFGVSWLYFTHLTTLSCFILAMLGKRNEWKILYKSQNGWVFLYPHEHEMQKNVTQITFGTSVKIFTILFFLHITQTCCIN